MAVLQAYFDESERPGGLFCVAGYVFSPPQAKKFIKDWSRLFAPYGAFHMKEFAHGRGAFSGVSQSERDALLKNAVRIINQTVTAGVAVSCRIAEMDALSPKWLRGFGHAYPVCCHWAMTSLIIVLDKVGVQNEVSYVFEKGHPHEAEARDVVKMAGALPELKAMYRHYADAFIPKSDAVPLQAADLLAWEWAKCKDETLDQDKRRLRGSLRALFEYDTRRYQIAHLGGQTLADAMARYASFGYEQLREEAALAEAAKGEHS